MKEKLNPEIYQAYVNILQEELVPAMGCTEPIALAYAAALARQELGCMPQMVTVAVSANIIKNVKSVVVPHTGGLRGIQAAVAAGTVAGDADRELEVLAGITEEQQSDIAAWRSRTPITVTQADSGFLLDIDVTVAGGGHTARVRLVGGHTNVVRIEKDGEVKLDRPCSEEQPAKSTDRGLLSVENIITFADQLDPEDVREVLQRQIDYNTAIAEEGLRGNYGANIGSIFLQAYGNGVHNRAKALAAAGSDARMNGCELPVVINSGSGNQGLTASLPVTVYARQMGADQAQLYRALAVSNLVTSTSKPVSANSVLSVVPWRPVWGPGPVCAICMAAGITKFPTPLSMPLRWIPVLSVMGPRPAVRPKSPPQLKPDCWACRCRHTVPSFTAGTASLPRAWRTTSATLARWPGKVCGKRTKRSSA